MKARTLRYLGKEGLRGLRHHRGMTVSAIGTMAAGLLVLGAFAILSYNVLQVLSGLQNRKEVVVYLKDGLTDQDREMVVNRLRMHPAVAEAVFVPRDEAWKEFSQSMDTDGLLDAVGENPLPDSYQLELDPAHRDAATIAGLAEEVGAWDEVDEVLTGGEWVGRLDTFAGVVVLVTLFIGLLVAGSIIAVIANTVRLTIVARRDLIEIMKLVGASESFIRVPFLSEGMFQAAVAGAAALALLFGVTRLLAERLPGVAFLSPLWCAAFLVFALLLGLAGSMLSVRHVLRRVGL